MKWIPVTDALPDKGFGSPYMTFVTEPVLMFGTWREDYPIVGHFVLQEFNDASGCNVEIPFEHPKYKYYSARCSYIDDLGALRKDWANKLPVMLTSAVTHWMPLPALPAKKPE